MDFKDNSLQARVARGITFMDETKPGWRENIDLTNLDMGDARMCIIGQTFRDQMDEYYTGAWTQGSWAVCDYATQNGIDLTDEDGEEWDERAWFGFEREGHWDVDYEALRNEWTRQLTTPNHV
jgi:hypothetical protein